MDLFKKFHERSVAASAAVVHRVAPSVVLDLTRLAVQVPRHREHGEMANNAPFIVAPQAGMTPAAFAEAFIAEFAGDPDFTVSFAKPGFINARLSAKALQGVVGAVSCCGRAGRARERLPVLARTKAVSSSSSGR